MKKNQW